jgi:hypothetical protein
VSEDVLVWNGRTADPAPSKRVTRPGLEEAAGQGFEPQRDWRGAEAGAAPTEPHGQVTAAARGARERIGESRLNPQIAQ